jgi:hypothetical protein
VDTESEHFFVMVGEVFERARMARLAVEVATSDGSCLAGVPHARGVAPEDPDQLDHTGFARQLSMDGEPVCLQEIVEVRLRRPGA